MAITYDDTTVKREFPDLDKQAAKQAAKYANEKMQYEGMSKWQAKAQARDDAVKYQMRSRHVI
jgi:hypothetical protein